MSGAVATRDAETVRELYGRAKRLTLAVAAALLAGERSPALADEVRRLYDDATRAATTPPDTTAIQLGACATAAAELVALRASVGAGTPSDAALARVRSAHSELRRVVWKVIPCEYVPCNAGAAVHRERSSDE